MTLYCARRADSHHGRLRLVTRDFVRCYQTWRFAWSPLWQQAGGGAPEPSAIPPWLRPESALGLRTYPARLRSLCPASRAVDPVIGTFDGDSLADSDKLWLVAADGGRLYVVWPRGFTLAFERGPTLRDEEGRVVAEQDTSMTLPQVNRFDHTGTLHDPYVARGSVLNGCYEPLAP